MQSVFYVKNKIKEYRKCYSITPLIAIICLVVHKIYGGQTGAVVRASDYGPSGPWKPWPGRRFLALSKSHLPPA